MGWDTGGGGARDYVSQRPAGRSNIGGQRGMAGTFPEREIIMALKTGYRLAPFIVAWPKGRKMIQNAVALQWEKCWPWETAAAGEGVWDAARDGRRRQWGCGCSGRGWAGSPSGGEGSCGGRGAAAICRLHKK